MWRLVFIGGPVNGDASGFSAAEPPDVVWWAQEGARTLPQRIWTRYEEDPGVAGQAKYRRYKIDGDEAFYVIEMKGHH